MLFRSRPGDSLPDHGGKGGLKIKVGKIRGVESHGMICSEQELGLSQDHDGILVLPATAVPGSRLVDVLPVQDWVLEIDNKSINHRPDLWGHYGFARELAAIYGRALKPLPPPVALPSAGKQVAVTITDRAACPRYCGLVIDGVRAEFNDGWALVRASNTSAAISCRFEAESEAALERIQGVFRQELQRIAPELPLTF